MGDWPNALPRVAAVGVMVALAWSSVTNHTDLPLNWGFLLAALLGVSEGINRITQRKAERQEKEGEKESES